MINNVDGIQPPVAPRPVESVNQVSASNGPTGAANVSDVVEISLAAKLAAKVHELPPVRTELVQRVKAEIEAGTYETPERIEAALDALMDDLYSDM